MKPTSIIFLVLSIILIITGYVGTEIASTTANNDGISLYNEETDEDGNRVNTIYFNSNGYDRVEVNISNATVYLIVGDEEKVVLKNYTEGSFTSMESGVSFIISDNISAVDMITSGNFNLAFKGLRHYWHDRDILSRDKEVYIYTTNATSLNALDVVLSSGKLVIDGYSAAFDVTAEVANGKINVNNTTATAFNFTGGNCDLTVEGSYAQRFHSSIKNGKINIKSTDISSLTQLAVTNEGSVNVELDGERADYVITAYASKEIKINGNKVGTVYPPENEDSEGSSDTSDGENIEITGSKTLDITVTSGTVNITTK